MRSLAYAELLFTFAVSLRRFEFELYKTSEDDVRIVHDYFMGMVRYDSKGVRVKVVRELDD